MFQFMFINYCFSTIRTLGTFYILCKDVWNVGFSENRKIPFILSMKVILVCNVPIVKMNRPADTISYHRARVVFLNMLGIHVMFQSMFINFHNQDFRENLYTVNSGVLMRVIN